MSVTEHDREGLLVRESLFTMRRGLLNTFTDLKVQDKWNMQLQMLHMLIASLVGNMTSALLLSGSCTQPSAVIQCISASH